MPQLDEFERYIKRFAKPWVTATVTVVLPITAED